jgi:hypothetical protein
MERTYYQNQSFSWGARFLRSVVSHAMHDWAGKVAVEDRVDEDQVEGQSEQ